MSEYRHFDTKDERDAFFGKAKQLTPEVQCNPAVAGATKKLHERVVPLQMVSRAKVSKAVSGSLYG